MLKMVFNFSIRKELTDSLAGNPVKMTFTIYLNQRDYNSTWTDLLTISSSILVNYDGIKIYQIPQFLFIGNEYPNPEFSIPSKTCYAELTDAVGSSLKKLIFEVETEVITTELKNIFGEVVSTESKIYFAKTWLNKLTSFVSRMPSLMTVGQELNLKDLLANYEKYDLSALTELENKLMASIPPPKFNF